MWEMIAGVSERERKCLARPLWCLGPEAWDGIRPARAATTCARAACYSQLVILCPTHACNQFAVGQAITFFSLLLLLPLLHLLQPSCLLHGPAASGESDATCQADSFLSIWAKVVISWLCRVCGWGGGGCHLLSVPDLWNFARTGRFHLFIESAAGFSASTWF